MNNILKIVGCALFFSYIFAAPPEKLSKTDSFKLTILHNNDMHARFEQTNALSNRCKEEDQKNNKCYGGFARVAHLVRKFRTKAQNGEIPPVLYLNAGDTYTGTPWFSIFKDNITAAFLDLLEPDAISLGNHEFDEGTENLAKFLNEISFPVLAANLILDKEPQLKNEHIKPSYVFTIKDTKVGIIGYLTPETKEVASPNNVEFIDEIEAINNEAAELTREGVKIIIALGHSGIERDKQIAQACPEVDLVIGGHSHTFLYTGNPPDSDKPYDVYPVIMIQSNGKKVPVVQSFAYTKYLGKLHLEFDTNGNLLEIDGEPIILDGNIEREKDVLELLEIYRPAVLELQNEIAGKTKVHLDGSCRRRECNLGNLIADSMVHWNALKYNGEGWTDAAIGIIQGGGIRASIEKNSIGISMEDLATVLPFESKVVVIEVSGENLLLALEHSVHRYTDGEEHGEFLQFSGMYVEYDMNLPTGQRVANVKIICAYCEVPKLENIDLKTNYRIILQDFLANGGDGYTMFKDSQVQESETLDIEVLKDFIRKKSPIYPSIEWRILITEYVDSSDDILGYTRVYLDSNCYRSECNLGNFVTDALVDWYSTHHNATSGWTDASVALIPANNIKHSIDNKVNNGIITRKDAMDILPQNNKIALAKLTGRILLEILEYNIHRYAQGVQPPEFLQVSGLQIVYDLSKLIGKRVTSVKVLCSSCTVPQLEDIKLDNIYNVLLPNNIATGSLGYTMVKNLIVEIFNNTEVDAIINYIKRKSPIYPSVEWRLSFNNLDPNQNTVGNTRVHLSDDCISQECNFGNFITDSMVDWYAMNYNGNGWTDAPIAIFQGSKIQHSINIGNITRSDVEKVFNPPNNLQVLTIKGKDLISLLEYSVSNYGDSEYNDFLQVSGIHVVFNMNKPSGNRITDLKVICSLCDIPELKQVNETAEYKILTQNDLIVDKYHDSISNSEIQNLNETDINIFLQYLRKKSPIYPAVEWRITIIKDEENTSSSPMDTTTLTASNLHISFILITVSALTVSFYK
ncbi:hypothetical protein ACKWTF_002334 [Chironomus riparius]